MSFVLQLDRTWGPFPVSTNNAYRNVARRGRVMVPEASQWKAAVFDAAWLAWTQLDRPNRAALLNAPNWQLRLVYRLHRTAARKDASNLIKLAEDACLSAVEQDDSRIIEVASRREYVARSEPQTLTVTLWADGQEGVA